MPPKCSAADLVRAVYHATSDQAGSEKAKTHTVLLGYVKANGEVDLFGGDQRSINVSLCADDKIIVFADH